MCSLCSICIGGHALAQQKGKRRLTQIAVLCPFPHLRTPQTVSRNSSNFTMALHKQENPKHQSLTQDAVSLSRQHGMNIHTKRTKIFYSSPEGKKNPYLLVLDSVLVKIFETKFLLLTPVDFSYAFTEKPVIRVKAFARKTWQRKYIKPTQHGYVCFLFGPKHYLLCDHECKKEFGRASLGRRPPWLPWRRLLSNQNQPAINTSTGKIWPKSISLIYK